MGLSSTVRALIAFGVAIVAMYVIEITQGAAMDELYLQFASLLHIINLSSGWQYQANAVLGGWVWYFRSFLIVAIAVGVWVVENIFIEVDYGRTNISSRGKY